MSAEPIEQPVEQPARWRPAGPPREAPRHGEGARVVDWRRCTDGEDGKACFACRVAVAAYEYHRQSVGGISKPVLGAHRRIRALMRLGWFSREIAAAAGMDPKGLRNLLTYQHNIQARYFDAIDRAYERLSMTHPPQGGQSRARQINLARRRGWAPPLAWDDIDNPLERPKGVDD